MATRPIRREEALATINKERAVYSQLLKQAQASGDKEAYQRYSDKISQLDAQSRATGVLGEIGSGIASAGVGLLTGIPDIVISGYNAAARPTVPMQTLRERLLNAAQIPTEATSNEGSIAYGAPEVGTAVASLGQLASLGYQGVRSWLNSRKVEELLNKLPTEQANRFRGLMLQGQGSPNSEVAAQIAQLRGNAQFKEIFNVLDNAATKAALSGMTPRPSRIAEPEAAQNLAKGVEDRLKTVLKARSEAGNTNFTKAFEQGGDRTILSPTNTLETIQNLKSQFAPDQAGNFASDSAKSAFNWLTSIEKSMAGVQPSSMGAAAGVEAQKLTVKEVQDRLKDWGRNASNEGGVVRDLAIGDEKRINAALFGAMKDDLKASQAAATTTADKKALGYLEQAREQTSKASQDYNTLVAQGIPDFLKGKNVADVSFEQLSGAYKNLNPSQRAVFRDWVGQNKAESLQAIDRDVFQAFKAKHTGTLDDGTVGTDLKGMAEDWAKMSPKEQDALASALGQNVNEFNGRMKDALVFTRRMNAGSLGAEEAAARGATRELSAVVGSTPLGYQGAKVTQLAGDILGGFKKGIISDELAMKTLLSDEAKTFLKEANLSPGSQKTFEALTKVEQAAPSRLEYLMPTNAVVAPVAPTQPQVGQEPQITIPDFNAPEMDQQQPAMSTQEPQIVIPNFNE